jgi:NADH-quinone oxidoreductase subunit M
MSLELLLIIAFGGAFLTYFSGKISSGLRNFFAVFISCALAAIVAYLYGKPSEGTFYSGFLGLPLLLRLNMLSWFFAIAIAVVGALSIIFSLSYIKGREKTDFYYLMMLLVNAGMLGIVLSGDLVSFYIFWEIMSWSAFLLISYNRGPALAAGMKYIIMSIVGSVAMLIGMLSLYANYGTLSISEVAPFVASASSGYILFILIVFSIAFGIKNAVLPFHTWLPDAHSEAPSPFSAVLSGILVRMGMYGFLLFFFVIVGSKLFLGLGRDSFHYILAWIGAINIVIPTFIAMLQNDSKRLLAWHGVGQGGYMVLGVALGTSLGVTGGTFHIVNHTSYIALLFLVVGAVEYRTKGIRDLNSLGGLIKKMPITFIGALVGACGLIGLPLTNGFVSKWLIYKSLILQGHPFLAFAALIGTWGTILSLYKFLHNMFLGQLPERYKNVEKAPFSMQFPIIIFSLIIILFGILPGIPLKVINSITTSFGLESLNINIWGIASETGALNTINIFAAILAAGLIVWLIFRAGPKAAPIAQDDNYAAGAYVPKEKYHYTVDFYNPLYRMISPYLRDFIDEFYMKLARGTQKLCGGIRHVYTGDVGHYVIYIVLFLASLIFVQIKWGIW